MLRMGAAGELDAFYPGLPNFGSHEFLCKFICQCWLPFSEMNKFVNCPLVLKGIGFIEQMFLIYLEGGEAREGPFIA